MQQEKKKKIKVEAYWKSKISAKMQSKIPAEQKCQEFFQ